VTLWAYNFIDNAFVRVEIEGQTGVAIQAMIDQREEGEGRGTHYFSIKTLEALFVVFVRTRPWRELLRGICENEMAGICSPLLFVWWMLSLALFSSGRDALIGKWLYS